MKASLFILILAVLLSSTLAMPYEDRDEQKRPNNGILQHLAHQYSDIFFYDVINSTCKNNLSSRSDPLSYFSY